MAAPLNANCHCISLDRASLARHFRYMLLREGSLPEFMEGRENLFAPYPVFASAAQWRAMCDVVSVAHEVMNLPAFRDDALAGVDWPDQHTLSAMMAFDFHPEPDGTKLIEINTNAGGAFLAALMAESQREACPEMRSMLVMPMRGRDAAMGWLGDFRNEWRLARGEAPLQSVLIVDDEPDKQFLYPEFLLFRALFRRAGIACEIADPSALAYVGGRLSHDGRPVDLVYNRCTDFALSEPQHATLRRAFRDDAVVLTPSPRHHALYADKRRLVRLSDQDYLLRIGVSASARRVLAAHVPAARIVTREDADALWNARRQYFFKPYAGYASRGAYRGERLTRRVWSEIVDSGEYIAQAYAPPPMRRATPADDAPQLKFDLRCVTYGPEVRLLSARLYQGQTTNLRTVSGGLASVFVLSPDAAMPCMPAQSDAGSVDSPNHTTA